MIEKLKTFADMPRRDWTTDIADAARYMAIVAREIAPPERRNRLVERAARRARQDRPLAQRTAMRGPVALAADGG